MGRQVFARTHRYLGAFLGLLAVAALSIALPGRAASQTVPDLGFVMVTVDMKAAQSVFVPDAEQALLNLLNQARRQHGLSSLVINRSLQSAARSHSREMALRGFIGHGSPSSGSFVDRLSGVVRPGTLVGENVTAGTTIGQVEAAFEGSSGHLQNMLDRRFRSVGIGIATAPMGMMVTEDFAD